MLILPLTRDRGVWGSLTGGGSTLGENTKSGRTIVATAGSKALLSLYFPCAVDKTVRECER